jgi:hypothetical protein
MEKTANFTLTLLLAGLLLLSCFGREEEDKDNFIHVNIRVTVTAFACANGVGGRYMPGDRNVTEPYLIMIEMGKAGALYCVEERTLTGSTSMLCQVDLYKEQPAEVSAYLQYSDNWVVASERLNWETVFAAAGFGGTFNWAPKLGLCVEGLD